MTLTNTNVLVHGASLDWEASKLIECCTLLSVLFNIFLHIFRCACYLLPVGFATGLETVSIHSKFVC